MNSLVEPERSHSEEEKLDHLELSLIESVLAGRDPDAYYQYRIEPYVNDPVLFCQEVLDFEPMVEQVKMLNAIAQNNHVSARSGRGIGKTRTLASVIWWYVSTRPHCIVPCTAPTENQLRDVLWAELARLKRVMDPYFGDMFDMTVDRVFNLQHPKTWYSVARTARKENSESFQGFHEENMMFICDEASGIPDEIYDVMEGAMTDVRNSNKAILVGNPTRTVGYFHASHHEFADKPWKNFHFSSEKSDLVSGQWLENMGERPGGKSSNFYRVHVLGEFPIEDESTVFPRPWLDAAVDRELEYIRPLSQRPIDSVGVDVAAGGDANTVFIFIKGLRVVGIKVYEKEDTMIAAGRISGVVRRGPDIEGIKRLPVPPDHIRMDVIGVGKGVYDRLMEQGLHVNGVDVHLPAYDPTLFANRRAELYWELRERFEEGSISIPPDKHLIRELANIRYEIDSRGRIIIWSKQKMRKEGIPSPDRADALMLAFSDYYPQEKAKPAKTWTQQWIDRTNQKPEVDPWEQWAKKNLKEQMGDFHYEDEKFAGLEW